MTFHITVCLRRVSLSVDKAISIYSCIWQHYKKLTMSSINFPQWTNLSHFWLFTMKLLFCQTFLYIYANVIHASILIGEISKDGISGSTVMSIFLKTESYYNIVLRGVKGKDLPLCTNITKRSVFPHSL